MRDRRTATREPTIENEELSRENVAAEDDGLRGAEDEDEDEDEEIEPDAALNEDAKEINGKP